MLAKIERNALCPCGSGKKYKKCCGKQVNVSWRDISNNLNFIHSKHERIQDTFFAVSDYLKEHPNPGACHLLSSILYVLLNEQQVNCVLRIGEVLRLDGKYFDHSWVEIDNLIFDVAIQLTYDEQRNPPVFAGIDLGTGQPTRLIYGASSPKGIDNLTRNILNTPFVEYMNAFPLFKDGAWEIIRKIAIKQLGLDVDISLLRKKYVKTQRVI